MPYKIGLVSLGCAKNLVDSEQMLYLLKEAGYELAEVEKADAVLLNTCGFIDDAKSEAIENVLDLAFLKKSGRLKAIIASGCLVERYKEELFKELPELDALVGCGRFGDIAEAVRGALAGERPALFGTLDAPVSETGRIPSTPAYTAYVRIAEGCDNCCSYCVIPSLRGPYRSRKREDILAECRALAEGGAKELIIIAQDITRYGLDIYGERSLASLAADICAIDGVEWVRLHYLYPDGIDEALIQTIKAQPKIVRYLDIPIQHIDDEILAAMHRRYGGQYIARLYSRLREELPGLVLRTSIIAGLPGETEEKFEGLCAFLKSAKIERAGVFSFSPQEGTPAAEMPGQVDDETKEKRAGLLRDIQERIMLGYTEALEGKTLRVLCEGYDKAAGIWFGRSFADSPDIDGKVFFTSKKRLREGDFADVKITGAIDCDPFGEAVFC